MPTSTADQSGNAVFEPLPERDGSSSSSDSSSASSSSDELAGNGMGGYKVERAKRAIKFYPSVDCGPISVAKAKEEIGFNPTPLEEAIRASVEFCNYCDQQ